jgi:hypothetical protein
MALSLQCVAATVRRTDLARCWKLLGLMSTLNTAGGILLDTSWYDPHLWCSTCP